MESIPRDILTEIFEYFSLNQLIQTEQLNKFFKNLIRTNKWKYLIIKLKNINTIEHVTKNYKFSRYDFSNSLITNKSVKLLGKCHTLDLSYCSQITDESVKFLGNCHKLNLFGCYKITNTLKHKLKKL